MCEHGFGYEHCLVCMVMAYERAGKSGMQALLEVSKALHEQGEKENGRKN